ncbi:sulfite exporter TauE/SafE family protein [Deinococcus lacus]|uniref:Probable membrane transporter protein n=1 Tax=Deinococcus lacus TaxID=392561 RepID=A0ABW1YEB6_9DEIO
MTLTVLALCIGILAGVLGAVLGLGGGVVVVPALEWAAPRLGHPLELTQAIAVSQVGVLAVGLSGAAAYLERGLVQVRRAYFLAPLTIAGGVAGSLLGLVLPAQAVAGVFAALLVYSAFSLLRGLRRAEEPRPGHPLMWPGMGFAGVMSGLLGVGGGTVQVPVLNLLGGLPIREAIATSTFIMGLTATANVAVYQAGGQLDTGLACGVALGVLAGARVGAGLQQRIPERQLRILFAGLLLLSAAQLLWKHWGGG